MGPEKLGEIAVKRWVSSQSLQRKTGSWLEEQLNILVGGDLGRFGLVRTGVGLNLSSSKPEADPDVAGQCWLQGLHFVKF